ncbi:MAG: hypothetical protein M3509_01375 [Chloroflexota bacterium]|nr:hypothetical protein [Chloroflexota bacterium]
MRPFTLFAATGDAVARLDWQGIDAGATGTTLMLEGSGAQSVAVDPHDPDRVFAGTFDHGVFRSGDGGASWGQVNGNVPHPRVPAVTISPYERVNGRSVVYIGTEPSNLYRSEDDGKSWQGFPAMLDVPSQPDWSFPPRPWTSHVRWIAPHPTDPSTIDVGIELGGIMRTRDGGQTWADRKPGSQPDAHALATHPAAPDRLYEAAGGGVAVSNDAGGSWHPTDDGMDRHYAWGLAVDSADPDLWYVSAASGPRRAHSSDGTSNAILYRKRGPSPWEPLGTPNGTMLRQPHPSTPYALIAPRDSPNSLIAGLHNGDLLVTDNAGDTWLAVRTGLTRLLALSEATI